MLNRAVTASHLRAWWRNQRKPARQKRRTEGEQTSSTDSVYEPIVNQHAVFPNMRKATGYWKMVEKFDAGLKQTLCAIIQTYHNDLEALTVGLRDFARSRLSKASYSDLMHCLVQSQVLGISPEGLLSQFVLADDKPHNLVPGKSWTLVPFPAPSIGTSGPSRA